MKNGDDPGDGNGIAGFYFWGQYGYYKREKKVNCKNTGFVVVSVFQNHGFTHIIETAIVGDALCHRSRDAGKSCLGAGEVCTLLPT